MSLSSLATTFRPARFDDVIGQRHVKVPLRQALASNRLPQQLLFVGGSGLGKTTLARIVAGSLLCPNRDADTSDACGTCESCTALAAGNHPDVIEFDAASHGQKDNMVELARRATLAPMLSTHRVFIIDEAHGLNRHLAPSGAGEVGIAHLRIVENSALEVCVAEISTSEVRPAEVSPGEIGVAEVGLVEPGVGEVGAFEVGVAEVGIVQPGVFQIDALEVGPFEFGEGELRRMEVERSKIRFV